MTKQILRAKNKDLQLWSSSNGKARYDYDSKEYRLADMLTDDFFGQCDLLRVGDQIFITDCEDQIMVVRVDTLERGVRKAWLSKLERIYAHPVVELRADHPDDPGLVYRFRTTAAGGHSIVTGTGEVVAINFKSRESATQAIAAMYEKGSFEPPKGCEPTAQFVKGAKIFKQGGAAHGVRPNVNRQPSDGTPR